MSLPFASSANLELGARIDRLVANELDHDDRRALLLQLDAAPENWRLCALAFLEDQAWRTALGRSRPQVAPIVQPPTPTSTRHRGRSSTTSRFPLAASLFIAVAAGGFLAGIGVVERSSLLAGIMARLNPPAASTQRSAEAKPTPGVSHSDDRSRTDRLALDEFATTDDRWAGERLATIPDYVKAQWERRGFQFEANRRLLGFDLQDGRRVAVPVDAVELDFVGRQPV